MNILVDDRWRITQALHGHSDLLLELVGDLTHTETAGDTKRAEAILKAYEIAHLEADFKTALFAQRLAPILGISYEDSLPRAHSLRLQITEALTDVEHGREGGSFRLAEKHRNGLDPPIEVVAEWILDHWRDADPNGPMTRRRLASELHLSTAIVQEALGYLIERGDVEAEKETW